jgi:hypothetical protein
MEKPTVLLKQRRDFSDVINATFSFISQEFKSYGKVFLYYAGIPILLTAIAGAFFSGTEMTRIFSQLGNVDNSSEMLGTSYFVKLTIVYVLSLIVYVFVSGLTAAYLYLYSTKGRNGFESSEVWAYFITNVWRLVALYLVIFLGFLLIGGGIGAILAGFSLVGAGGVGAVITIFLSMLIFFVLVFYVSVPLSMGYLVIYVEDRRFGSLFKRVFDLVKGNWWQTFGVIFVLFLIYSMISSLFSIPVIISSAMQGYLSASGGEPVVGESLSFTMILVSLISTLGQFVMYPIILIGIGVQYFNLREQKDNEGLLEKVAEMVEQ